MNLHTITPHQVMAHLARGERVSFVDARPQVALPSTQHTVSGAVRADLANGAPQLLPGGLVVVYGDDGWELAPLRVAQQLSARGHANVRILAGGLPAWEAAHPAQEPRTRA